MTTRTTRAFAALATLSISLASLACTPPAHVEEARLGAPAVAAASPIPTVGAEARDGVVLLGPSALYYMYTTNRAATSGTRDPSRYQVDRTGRVYYRDAKFETHWVTPPQEGIRVSAAEAEHYAGFAGYRGIPEGRDLTGLPSD